MNAPVYESLIEGWPVGPLGVAINRKNGKLGILLRSKPRLSKSARRMAIIVGKVMIEDVIAREKEANHAE